MKKDIWKDKNTLLFSICSLDNISEFMSIEFEKDQLMHHTGNQLPFGKKEGSKLREEQWKQRLE